MNREWSLLISALSLSFVIALNDAAGYHEGPAHSNAPSEATILDPNRQEVIRDRDFQFESKTENPLDRVDVPVLVLPEDSSIIEANLPTFIWIGGGTTSILQIDTDVLFPDPDSFVIIDDTSFTLTSPIPNSKNRRDSFHYYWRVKSVDSSGTESEYSDPFLFDIDGPHRVPSEFPDIRSAYNGFPSYSSGQVLVSPGVYTGINNCCIGGFGDKRVDVVSSEGPEFTIIDCQGIYFGFHYDDYSVSGTILDGFTILNSGPQWRGAIVCDASGVIDIRNCRIKGSGSNGLYCNIARSNLTNCTITNSDSSAVFIQHFYVEQPLFESCSFVNNRDVITALDAYPGYGDSVFVTHSIVALNNGAPVNSLDSTVEFEFSCSDVYGNLDGDWIGNIAEQLYVRNNMCLAPQFCAPAVGDYSLYDSSPCLPENNECGQQIGSEAQGCLSDHVWYVSEDGDDVLANGSEDQPFRTIQRGINQASTGDTVLVADGTYHERISYFGKPIVVGSWILRDADSAHIVNTIIDGDTAFVPMVGDTGSVVRFVQWEDSNSVLAGLTIRGAAGSSSTGAGVLCRYGSPMIVDCHLTGNVGANISAILSLGNPTFLRCDIFGNSKGARVQSFSIRLDSCFVDSLQEILSDGDTYATGSTFRSVRFGSPNSMSGRATIDHSLLINCTIDYGIRATLTSDSLFDSDVIVWDQDTAEINECVFIRSLLYVNDAHCNVRRSRMEDGITVQAQNLQRILIEDSFIGDTLRVFGSRTLLTARRSTFVGHGISFGFSTGRDTKLRIEECIIVTDGEPAVVCSTYWGDQNLASLYTKCNDYYGFNGLNWLGGNLDSIDTAFSLTEDPQFCDTGTGDYTILASSPCAPANNSCGILIGALDVGCGAQFLCGDSDGSNTVSITDVVYLINYIFAGGPPPSPLLAGDADCSGALSISDAVYLINYIFAGGPQPCATCP